MRHAKTLLAVAAVVLLSAPAFAQVTPGGPGERKNNQSPSITATQSPAGTQPGTQTDFAKGKKPMTTGKGAGEAGSGQGGARKANEAPGMSK